MIFRSLSLKSMMLRPESAFVVLALVFGLLSAILVPQLSNNDENMHFLRAYNMASFTPLGARSCSYPRAIFDKSWGIYTNDYAATYTSDIDSNDTITAPCGSAAGYSPIMHLPQAVAIFFAKIFSSSTGVIMLAGRIGNLLFYIAMMCLVIKYARIGKWALFVIALLPFMIQTAGSLSADVMNNVVVLGVISFTINLFSQKNPLTRYQLGLIIVCAILAALTKPTNILILLPLAFLPSTRFTPNGPLLARIPFNLIKWSTLILAGIAALASLFAWQKLYGAALVSAAPDVNPLNSNPLHFVKILYNTYIDPVVGYSDLVLRGAVGEFASFRYHLPTYMIMFCFIVLFISLLYKPSVEKTIDDRRSLRWLALSSLTSLTLLAIVIAYALYTSWAIQPFRLGPSAPYADGVQGRYFTAALGLLIAPSIWLRRYIFVGFKNEKLFTLFMVGSSSFVLLFYLIETVFYFLHS